MKNKNKVLLKKSAIYFVGNLSSKILNFLLVPIYAYTVTASDLGIYDYIITIASIVVPLVYIVLWDAILKFTLSYKEVADKVITTSATYILLVTLFFIPITYCFFKYIYNIGVNALYISLIFAIYGLTNIWQYYARALEKNNIYMIASIIAAVTNLFLNILTICIMKMGFAGLAISYIISNIFSIMIIECNIKIFTRIKFSLFDKKILKDMIKFSFPLVLNTISAWLLTGMSKVLITNKLGNDVNGLYSFANKFSVLVTLIGSVINMAFVEESIIASKKENIDNDFLDTVIFLFKNFLILIIIFIPVINVFYNIISNTEYFLSQKYVPFLLIYALLSTMATNVGAIFHIVNKTKYAFLTTFLGAIVFILIAILLVDRFGLISVIVAQVIGAFVMFESRYIYACKYCRIKGNVKSLFKIISIYIIISIVSFKVNILANCVLEIFILVCLVYYYRIYLLSIYNKLFRIE